MGIGFVNGSANCMQTINTCNTATACLTNIRNKLECSNIPTFFYLGTMFSKPILSLIMPTKSTNKIQIGNEILQKFVGSSNKLFINEDSSALKSAFESEFELIGLLMKNDYGASFRSVNIIHLVVAVFAICLVGMLFIWNHCSSLANLLVICFCVCLLLVLFWSLYYQKYRTNQFKMCFELLISQSLREKELYKKLMQLIEDNSVFAMSVNQQNRVNALKICFRDIGWQCFVEYRSITLLVKDEFPLKDDIDNDLICLFPIESFESYHNDEELNHRSLKSLKQLIRLQISEFYKRVLFLFICNYYKNSCDFKKDLYNFLETKIFNLCIKNTQERQSKLLSILSYHKSLFYEKIDANKIDFLNNNSLNLWPVCRNIRKDLYSSLSNIDDCEAILETNNGDLSPENKAILRSKFGTLTGEIDNIHDSVKSLLKSLTLCDLKTTSNDNAEINENCIDENKSSNGQSKLIEEAAVLKDEVYEAYVDQSDREKHHDVFEVNDKSFAREIEASSNVYRELKNALKGKAIEHKVREAKAQGIDVDVEQLEEEYNTNINKENINNHDNNHNHNSTNIDQLDIDDDRKEFLNFDFNFALNLHVDSNEDTFEYENDNNSYSD